MYTFEAFLYTQAIQVVLQYILHFVIKRIQNCYQPISFKYLSASCPSII